MTPSDALKDEAIGFQGPDELHRTKKPGLRELQAWQRAGY
jgi:hypothetical protein